MEVSSDFGAHWGVGANVSHARINGDDLSGYPEIASALKAIAGRFPGMNLENTGIGSTIFAVKPGDGSAREQAASCQRVLGGCANIANEYATKRYRSNLINWGMIPFLIDGGDLPFKNGDYIFIPGIRNAVENRDSDIAAYVAGDGDLKEFVLHIGSLTDDERQIIEDGCLINYYREGH